MSVGRKTILILVLLLTPVAVYLVCKFTNEELSTWLSPMVSLAGTVVGFFTGKSSGNSVNKENKIVKKAKLHDISGNKAPVIINSDVNKN
ncbi:MAG: hypothetical protein II747_01510 [Clostridia bacterium]|nr:hypothetical protein [Clostridia bacterium]